MRAPSTLILSFSAPSQSENMFFSKVAYSYKIFLFLSNLLNFTSKLSRNCF